MVRYILLKTPPKLDQWFRSYEQLKDSQTKEIHIFFWLYLTIYAPDFRLIPTDGNTFIHVHVYSNYPAVIG